MIKRCAVFGFVVIFSFAVFSGQASLEALDQKVAGVSALGAPQKLAALKEGSSNLIAYGHQLEDLSGNWSGRYFGSGGRKSSNNFQMTLSVADGECHGNIEEPNTFGKPTSDKLFATVRNCSLSLEQGDYVFSMLKTYDGTAGVSHSVEYIGVFYPEHFTVVGNWRIGGATGEFDMCKDEYCQSGSASLRGDGLALRD